MIVRIAIAHEIEASKLDVDGPITVKIDGEETQHADQRHAEDYIQHEMRHYPDHEATVTTHFVIANMRRPTPLPPDQHITPHKIYNHATLKDWRTETPTPCNGFELSYQEDPKPHPNETDSYKATFQLLGPDNWLTSVNHNDPGDGEYIRFRFLEADNKGLGQTDQGNRGDFTLITTNPKDAIVVACRAIARHINRRLSTQIYNRQRIDLANHQMEDAWKFLTGEDKYDINFG